MTNLIPSESNFEKQEWKCLQYAASTAHNFTNPMKSTKSTPAYVPLERLEISRPVDRIPFIKDFCKNRVVLDLGAMDETAFMAKRGQGTWLHEEICNVATQVMGIDNSTIVPPEGIPTGAKSRIYRGDISSVGELLDAHEFTPDIVVAGEIIEHLENPLAFLRSIKAIKRLHGKVLILTTPNATALHNCMIGMLSRESTHHDHLCIFSYKTLYTLCKRAGVDDWQIIPYLARFTEMKARNAGIRRCLVAGGERVINGLEWLFPMMGFGYVVVIQV